jgi:NADH-quinone oxidoreductase subunit H
MYVLINIFFTIIPLLIAVAYLTLAERKVLAAIQRRKGPNVNGIIGILQPIIDGLKLVLKETIILNVINKQIFILSPIFTFSVSLVNWSILPLSEGIVITDSEFGVLFILAISSLGVYGIILSGWSSNSRYAFLGACRSAAQMISYRDCIKFNIN